MVPDNIQPGESRGKLGIPILHRDIQWAVFRMVSRVRVNAFPVFLRAVNVNWNGDGWNVNANSVENPNDWNAGNRAFSRNCCFLPSIWREFYLKDLFSIRRAFGRFLPIFARAKCIYRWESTCSPRRFE